MTLPKTKHIKKPRTRYQNLLPKSSMKHEIRLINGEMKAAESAMGIIVFLRTKFFHTSMQPLQVWKKRKPSITHMEIPEQTKKVLQNTSLKRAASMSQLIDKKPLSRVGRGFFILLLKFST